MKAADPEVQLLQAMADPVRLSIVRQLAAGDDAVCACDFTECCTVSQPTVSHHLKVLRDAGVVTTRRQGTVHLLPAGPRLRAALGQSRAPAWPAWWQSPESRSVR